jgi:hypothetical protein
MPTSISIQSVSRALTGQSGRLGVISPASRLTKARWCAS